MYMDLFISEIVSSIIRVLLFALIPLIWWWAKSKDEQKFLEYIGIKKIDSQNVIKVVIWTASMAIMYTLFWIVILPTVYYHYTNSPLFYFEAGGFQVVPTILIYGIFYMALPVEILFRGFLLKRLQTRHDFQIANLIQALIFGILQGILLISLIGAPLSIAIIAFSTGIAWFMGYINEEHAEGSILPSIAIYSTINIVIGIEVAFGLFV